MTKRSILEQILVILFWVGVWAVAAELIDNPLLLPSPISVFARIFTLVHDTAFWNITLLSLFRMMGGIIVAVLIGVVLAFITSSSRVLNLLLEPLLTVVKVTPVASFIILFLIWIGRDTVPMVIAGMMVLPVVWTNVSTGLRNIDNSLMEMADVYQVPRPIKLKRIIVPSIMPYFLSAVQTSIGIGWKAGIAAEVLTVPKHSIGKMIFESKLYLETTDLFAWTVVVIIISLAIEKLLMASIRKLGASYHSEVMADD